MRLKDAVEESLIENGEMGTEKLAMKAGVSPTTIRKIIAGHIPLPKTAYKVALACDRTKEDALQIAKECTSDRARDTA